MSQGRPIQKHGAKRSSSTSYTPSLSSSSLSSLSPSSQSSVSQTHLATSSINHSHTWIVSNSELVTQYRYKPKLYLESPFFIAGERRWQLRLFPFGDVRLSSLFLSFSMSLIQCDVERCHESSLQFVLVFNYSSSNVFHVQFVVCSSCNTK